MIDSHGHVLISVDIDFAHFIATAHLDVTNFTHFFCCTITLRIFIDAIG